MNTKIIVGSIGASVIAVGLYAVWYERFLPSVPSGKTNPEQFTGSLTELAARGGEWTCTVDAQASTGVGQVASSGIVYVSDNKVRADFESDVPNFGAVQAHMIADAQYVHSWTSAMPQGIKTKAIATATHDPSVPTQAAGYDAQQSYTYDCTPGSVDASLFEIPANITFMTL